MSFFSVAFEVVIFSCTCYYYVMTMQFLVSFYIINRVNVGEIWINVIKENESWLKMNNRYSVLNHYKTDYIFVMEHVLNDKYTLKTLCDQRKQ